MAIVIAISRRQAVRERAPLCASFKACSMLIHNAPSTCVRVMCDAFVDLAQYHAIVTVTTLPATQICNQDSRASVRSWSWLESSMNVNHEQWWRSTEFYTNAIQDGNIASNSMTAANIGNDAALGQALFMVGNAT